MEWIKKNPHLFSLSILAVVLLASAGMVIANSQQFAQGFSGVLAQVTPNNTVKPLDFTELATAKTKFETPGKWSGDSLFVPERYVIGKENMPQKVTTESFYHDSLTKLPIPNKWFLDHGLPLSDSKVQYMDPDGDHFTNEDEWRGSTARAGEQSTDPNDPKSHPPYYTKLFMKKFIRVSFLFIFQSWDGDKTKPETMEFQINPKNMGGRAGHTVFLKLGDPIANSNYVLKNFEYKTQKNANTGEDEDVSELILLNTETNETIALKLGKLTDSPDSYGLFTYELSQPAQPIQVKKTKTFVLLPEKDKQYKLLDIQENKAVVQTPDGQQVTILPDPRQP